jgi:virulence-associated protein VapD
MMKRILSGASQRQVNYGNITSGMPYVKGNSYVCIQKAMKQTTRNDMMNFFERYGAKVIQGALYILNSTHSQYLFTKSTIMAEQQGNGSYSLILNTKQGKLITAP